MTTPSQRVLTSRPCSDMSAVNGSMVDPQQTSPTFRVEVNSIAPMNKPNAIKCVPMTTCKCRGSSSKAKATRNAADSSVHPDTQAALLRIYDKHYEPAHTTLPVSNQRPHQKNHHRLGLSCHNRPLQATPEPRIISCSTQCLCWQHHSSPPHPARPLAELKANGGVRGKLPGSLLEGPPFPRATQNPVLSMIYTVEAYTPLCAGR